MDTRRKILGHADSLRLAAGPGCATLVIGHFDVLRRDHGRALEHAARPLIAVVLESADSILPVRARAELAAGLRAVDHVITAAEPDIDGIVAAARPASVLRLVEQERLWAAELQQRVRRRGAV